MRFHDVTLRDAQQSLLATRLSTEKGIEIIELLSDCGFYSLEVWGGATLDSALRFLKEDPWDRLRRYKALVGNKVKLRALCRGQNLFGYSPYPDAVVEEFNRLAVKTGIDLMRIFDALNDFRNLEVAIRAVKAEKGEVDGAISYTTGPVFNVSYFVQCALELEKLGVDAISIKDMAGLLAPPTTTELISLLKSKCLKPIYLHTHCTPGFAHLNIVIAMMKGVDGIDTTFYPLAGGSSLPCLEIALVFTELLGIPTALDPTNFEPIRQILYGVRKDLSQYDIYQDYFPKDFSTIDLTRVRRIAAKVIHHIEQGALDQALSDMQAIEALFGMPPGDERLRQAQIPGGMYTNLLEQLKELNAVDRLDEVLHEVSATRKDAGYVPLVTPTSQIVGVQAVLNVIYGRYQIISEHFKELMKGNYGKTPAPVNLELREKICQKESPSSEVAQCRLANPVLKEYGAVSLCRDNYELLLYELFPQVAFDFLKRRREQEFMAREKAHYHEEYATILDQIEMAGYY